MFLKAFFVLSGIAGTATSVGIPIVVQEFQRLSSVGGKDGVDVPFLTSLSQFSGPPNQESRKQICQELGFNKDSSPGALASSSIWDYGCENNRSNDLEEQVAGSFYTGTLKQSIRDSGRKLTVKCLNREKIGDGSDRSMEVDGTQCKKK